MRKTPKPSTNYAPKCTNPETIIGEIVGHNLWRLNALVSSATLGTCWRTPVPLPEIGAQSLNFRSITGRFPAVLFHVYRFLPTLSLSQQSALSAAHISPKPATCDSSKYPIITVRECRRYVVRELQQVT